MNNFWFVRGVSGAGKSTVSSLLSTLEDSVHIEADMFRMTNNVYVYNQAKNHTVHNMCFETAKEQMGIGRKNVIVANTSTRNSDVNKYQALAEEMGYRFLCIVVEKRHDGENTHGVEKEKLNKMESQLRNSIKLN